MVGSSGWWGLDGGFLGLNMTLTRVTLTVHSVMKTGTKSTSASL